MHLSGKNLKMHRQYLDQDDKPKVKITIEMG